MAKSIKVALELDTRDFDKGIKNVKTKTDSLGGSFSNLGSIIAGVFTGFAVKNVVDATLKMENFRSTITAYLGSQTLANQEIERLSELSKGLTQDVDDVTNSFIVLKRNGIDTSSEALTAFSKVAAGNNKTFSQLAEAVADGLTGEFERLKEFGIKVSKENDKFVIRMADGSKQVVNSAREVVDAVRAQGEEGGKFANVVAGPLNQAFSNLRGSVFEATSILGDGFAPALSDAAAKLSEFINENKEFITNVGQAMGTALEFIANNLNAVGAGLAIAFGPAVVKSIMAVNAAIMKNPLGLVLGVVSMAVTAFISLYNEVGSVGTAFKVIANGAVSAVNTIINYFSGAGKFISELFKGVGEYLKDAINPFENADWTGSMGAAWERAKSEFDSTIESAGPFELPFEIPPETFASVRADLQSFRDLQQQIFSDGEVKNGLTLLQLEALAGQYQALGEDLLKKGLIEGETFNQEMTNMQARVAALIALQQLKNENAVEDEEQAQRKSDADARRAEAQAEREQAAEERRVEHHRKEMLRAQEVLAQSQAKFEADMRDLDTTIEKIGLTDTQIEQLENTNDLNREREAKLAEIARYNISDEEKNRLQEELNQLYDDQIALSNEKIAKTREEQRLFTSGWKEAWAEYRSDAENNSKRAKELFVTFSGQMENAFVDFVMTGKANFRDLVSDMIKQLLKIVAKKIFVKIIDLLTGGLGSLFEGFFDTGGRIGAGKFGIVGERGPEIVTGPAQVIGRRETAELMNQSAQPNQVNYTINAIDTASFKSLISRDPEFIYNVTVAGSRRIPR